MSLARDRFLGHMRGALVAAQDPLLLDNSGDPDSQRQAARLLRNGLAVTSFASFEMFVRDRLKEVATWLSSQSVPFSAFPAGLQEAPRLRAPGVLTALMKRDPASPDISTAHQELGAAWTQMHSGGGWTLPHVSLLWEGSNLSAGTLLEIAILFGVASGWQDLSGVAKGAGFAVLPTSQLFNQIAERRHSSAHDAGFDADAIVLRATPATLLTHAFSFDALISSSARSIAGHAPPQFGRSAIALTTLDQSASAPTDWTLTSGFLDTLPAPGSSVETGDEPTVTMTVRARLTSASDVLQVRKWNGSFFETTDWFTMGV